MNARKACCIGNKHQHKYIQVLSWFVFWSILGCLWVPQRLQIMGRKLKSGWICVNYYWILFFFVNEIMVKSWEYRILGCEFWNMNETGVINYDWTCVIVNVIIMIEAWGVLVTRSFVLAWFHILQIKSMSEIGAI